MSARDDGTAFDPDDDDQIFTALERLRSRGEHEGAAGLARSKRVLERRDGGRRIRIESGIGSASSATIPAGGSDD